MGKHLIVKARESLRSLRIPHYFSSNMGKSSKDTAGLCRETPKQKAILRKKLQCSDFEMPLSSQ